MRTDPAIFTQRNAELARSPRYVIELSFAEDNSELWYFTSHADIQLHAGALSILRVVRDVSVTSQSLSPDTASATIGNITFDLVDYASAVSNAMSAELLAGRTARRRRVRVFFGFEGMAWTDPASGPQAEYALVQTQVATLVEFDKGAYHFTCADIQREMRKNIFTLAKTNLSSGLGASRLRLGALASDAVLNVTDTTSFPSSGSGIIRDSINDKDLFTWTGKTATTLTGCSGVLAHNIGAIVCDAVINVYSTTGFSMVAHGTSYSDLPSTTAGYVKIEKEVCSYTGSTSTTLTGVVRGTLNTFAVDHPVDGASAQDSHPTVEEYVYLELPAVDMAYRILTGKDRLGNVVMPTNWNLGIPTSFVRLSDFTDIGTDLWDTADDSAGLVGLLQDIGKTDGKKFIEAEICLLTGCFMPVHADGALGYKRQANILAGAAYAAMLDESNVISWGPLLHDYEAVRNVFEINWNWEPSQKDFTRKTDLVELASALLYKNAPIAKLNFRLLHASRHTPNTIAQRFDAFRDRYSGPPEKITLNGVHRLNQLEVGEVIRLRLGEVRDFAAAGGAGPIDRSFEIQSMSVNWITGQLTLQLFATSRQPGPLSVVTDATVVPDAWYSSEGTQVVNGTGGLTVSGTNPIHISGSGTLAGNNDMLAAGAIYYLTGDVQIDAGANVNITQNVQLRIKGQLTNNGTINGVAAGRVGGADLVVVQTLADYSPGTIGFLGTTQAQGAASIGTTGGAQGVQYAIFSYPQPSVVGLYQTMPLFNIVNNGTILQKLPKDLRGTSGSSGGAYFTGNFFISGGGAGGTGGAGFLIACRGYSRGASGKIDLSGGPGGTGVPGFKNGGAGGAPGGLLIVLDGASSTATGLDESGFVALNGVTPVGNPAPETVYLLVPSDSVGLNSYYRGTGDGATFPVPSLSGGRGGCRVQYAPKFIVPSPWIRRPFDDGRDIIPGTVPPDRLGITYLADIVNDLGEIIAGSIRGVNVNASSHTTKGSYLTVAASAADATLNVRNTSDFPASGSGWIIDTTNDRDAFTYTGKTATTLTGCSGVLAHNIGATIIPQAKCIVLDGPTNEVRFYGDRGDGTIEELAAIGEVDDGTALGATMMIGSQSASATRNGAVIWRPLIMMARLLEATGGTVASANDLSIGSNGNAARITGSTQINRLDSAGWANGSRVTLIFAAGAAPLLKHNQAAGSTFRPMRLAGSVDFAATAHSTITFIRETVDDCWNEIGRKVS